MKKTYDQILSIRLNLSYLRCFLERCDQEDKGNFEIYSLLREFKNVEAKFIKLLQPEIYGKN